ncbi:hypothetical protein VP01_1004g1 [Puccinia sorghi]|uniref:Uncharacterized protein n=1 Tax=Puccinia sorghi TaxID=27349 RepID=A0A0L6VV74_9BASI|nr:hypothetical protein VP01_1004g1 [Puccinia sorghi]
MTCGVLFFVFVCIVMHIPRSRVQSSHKLTIRQTCLKLRCCFNMPTNYACPNLSSCCNVPYNKTSCEEHSCLTCDRIQKHTLNTKIYSNCQLLCPAHKRLNP